MDARKPYNRFSLALTIGAIAFAVICYYFDPGPLVPPFSLENSLDCRSVRVGSHRVENSTVFFDCEIGETYQFPVEFVSHFLRVTTETNGNSLPYDRPSLSAVARVNETITFAFNHSMVGPVGVGVCCLKHEIDRFEINVDQVDREYVNEDMSSQTAPGNDFAKFENVCIESGKLLYFSALGGRGRDIRLPNDDVVRFEIIKMGLSGYEKHKDVNRTNGTTMVLPAFDPVPWRSTLFSILPISNAIEANEIENDGGKLNIFFNDLPRKGSSEIMKPLYPHTVSKIKDIMCFEKLVFPYAKAAIATSDDIEFALGSNFTYLRNAFSKGQATQRKILLAENFARFEASIKSLFPEWKVFVVTPESGVARSAAALATSSIFVGDHISNLLNIIWMKENMTAVIDASPKTVSCNNWVQLLAERMGVTYYNLTQSDRCDCSDFSCYPQEPFGTTDITQSELETILLKAVAEIEAIPPQTVTIAPADEDENAWLQIRRL